MSNDGKTGKLSRRAFIRATAGAVGGAILVGCAPKVVKETVIVEKPVEVVVKEIVKETVIVEGTPQVVEKVVEKVVTATPAPLGPVTVLWWHSHGGALGELFDKFSADFSAANADITIQPEYQGGYDPHRNKLSAAAVTDTLPDMIHIGDGYCPVLGRGGLLLALDDLVDMSEVIDLSEYKPIVSRGIIDGIMFSLPLAVSTPIYYYNKDVLDAAGFDGAPDTWEAFYAEYLPKLTTADMVAFGYQRDIWWQQSALRSMGVMVDNSILEMDFANPAIIGWFERMQAARQEGTVYVPTSADGGNAGFFGSGLGAMNIASSGLLTSIDGIVDGKFVVEVAYLPGGPGGRQGVTGGNGLSICRGVKDDARDAAFSFIEYLQSPEQIATYDRASGYLPFTVSSEALMAGDIEEDPRRKIAFEQAALSQWIVQAVWIGRCKQALKDAWNECVETDVNVQERLERAQVDIVQIAKEEGFEPVVPS